MISENPAPDNLQDQNQSGQENIPDDQKKNAIGKSEASEAKKHYNVLHKDGSFADLPYNNEPGGGTEEGTVGLGH